MVIQDKKQFVCFKDLNQWTFLKIFSGANMVFDIENRVLSSLLI